MKYTNFMDGLEYRRLILTPSAGASISECIREAIILCLTKDCTVAFNHNGGHIEVDPRMFIDFVYEAWEKQRND